MKKIAALACLLACTVFSSGASLPSAAEPVPGSGIALQLNGEAMSLSAEPRMMDSTLMVPLRDIAEALGVEVDWDETRRTATAKKEELHIGLTVDDRQATRQDHPIQLETAPRMENGKLFVPLRFFSESFDFNVMWDGPNQTVSIVDPSKSLPAIGTEEHLQQLLQQASSAGYAITMPPGSMIALEDSSVAVQREPVTTMKEKSAASVPAAAPSNPAPSYSTTNVQVEGVDESDMIKTDGTYIYQVNRNRVIITEAYPADRMKVVQALTFEDVNFRAAELYIDDKQMVVIGSTHYPVDRSIQPAGSQDSSAPAVQPVDGAATMKKIAVLPVRPQQVTTKAIIYELGNRSSTLKKVREVELEGSYVSSRKVGSSLYLIANKHFGYYPILRVKGGNLSELKENSSAPNYPAPAYKDSAAGDEFIHIGYEDIRYFPESVQPNYLMIGGVNLEQPDQKMSVQSYLGSGSQVYASPNNIYVVTNEYTSVPVQPQDIAESKRRIAFPMQEHSVIYKFGMGEGKIRYAGRGKVPGHSINQFAMDESNGYFRIATTQGQMDSSNQYVTTNQMYVLDESLKTIGNIEDIAPGEQIYSVRYAGDRAYMVTFRTVDPLFVIDLKQPQEPKILGKLKIPGYSNYLHPYDENHLIGFGKDTLEVSNDLPSVTGMQPSSVFYQGMKMALFDVTDVEHPKVLYTENIGDRGTDSELLHNHKALLYSKEQGILAFPVTVREVDHTSSPASSVKENAALRYGSFTFQGAYVYKLDLTGGFKLQGKITHLTQEDYDKSGQYGSAFERNIRRILSIGTTLYTSSEQMLKATELASFKDVGSVTLP
ncbi:beta-propeller domain-containing protein [Paenibacillus rigui]|uniref:Copper amine oxidase-like N-terminal domain-containing protein n=1 Tax=Paenibacillus rigui TaxID=554312 RepID=A0A229ULI4_9BACL|nr:beta-propeller domain-containing protein [Paenibacillus rigui]OXM84154.1 hypothetical protein CF651_22215 [Paenibacillus rigui]